MTATVDAAVRRAGAGDEYFGDVAVARSPKAARQFRAKVRRVDRRLSVAESESEIRGYGDTITVEPSPSSPHAGAER